MSLTGLISCGPVCSCVSAEEKNGINPLTGLEDVTSVVPALQADGFQEEAVLQADINLALPFGSKFSTSLTEPLSGVPLAEGELYHIVAEDRVDTIRFSLYINGFSFARPNSEEVSMLLSPFCLVRCCKFQHGNLSQFWSFKIHHFTQDRCQYFAVKDSTQAGEAERERSRWVLSLSHAIHIVTRSLFPAFNLMSKPLQGAPVTSLRLLAGYLLHSEDPSTVSLLYCELRAPSGLYGRLVVYEDERCLKIVREFTIDERSIYVEVLGINCGCFSLCGHHFAARTNSERKLWLRAISNVKVKLETRAPNPGPEQLVHYRYSVDEQLQRIAATFEEDLAPQALLPTLLPSNEAQDVDPVIIDQVKEDLGSELAEDIEMESELDEIVAPYKAIPDEKTSYEKMLTTDAPFEEWNGTTEEYVVIQSLTGGHDVIGTATKEKMVGRLNEWIGIPNIGQRSVNVSL